MKITEEQVRHVAKLSKLAPDGEELELLQKDLGEILSAMRTLAQTEPGERACVGKNFERMTRSDAVTPSFDRAQLLANAPAHNGECIIVPKTVE